MRRGIILLLLILVLYSTMVNAVAIGVSKATLNYETVLRNGYAQDSLIVSTDSNDAFGLEIEVEGDIDGWVRFEPENITISAENPGVLTIIIEPPEDAANGIYDGEIRLLTTPVAHTQSGNLGTAIRTSFLIRISVEISGDEIIACTAGGFSIADSEITYPLVFQASVNNNGNVRIRPNFEIDVWNQEQTKLLLSREFTYTGEILPTTTGQIARDIEDVNLDTGQYWAEIKSPMCGETGLVTFEIVEKGEIVDKGEILSVKNPLWAEVGEIVPIEVVFKNTGSRVESAKIKGTIKLAGQIIKVIDTDSVDVAPGDIVNLETFFNPKMPGQYIINARVLYNNKLTYWKSSILNALPSEEFEKRMRLNRLKDIFVLAIFMIIIIAILLLLILIKRKKKRKKKIKFNF